MYFCKRIRSVCFMHEHITFTPVYVCAYVCLWLFVFVYVCMFVCMKKRMYFCMYVTLIYARAIRVNGTSPLRTQRAKSSIN